MSDEPTIILASGEEALMAESGRLVDLVDGLLDHGVAIRGEAWISVADVDLVFLGLDVILSDPEKIKPKESLS